MSSRSSSTYIMKAYHGRYESVVFRHISQDGAAITGDICRGISPRERRRRRWRDVGCGRTVCTSVTPQASAWARTGIIVTTHSIFVQFPLAIRSLFPAYCGKGGALRLTPLTDDANPSVAVHPLIQVPNQLVGAPVNTDVTLQCHVEASPKAINYWTRESGNRTLPFQL
jgi:hypothetical protein